MIPPTIHYRKGNPKIKFEEWNIEIPITLTPWPIGGPRRISTNSFGYGGTNAHAILDDAYHYLKARGLQGNHYTNIPGYLGHGINNAPNGVPNNVPNGISNGLLNGFVKANGANGHHHARLFVLSAQDKEGLKRLNLTLAEYLKVKSAELEDHSEATQTYLRDLAFTLSQRKSQLQWRTFRIASSLEQLSQSLNDGEADAVVHRSTKQPRIGFIFTGQGAQWPRMGTELMSYTSFRESVNAADEYLGLECGCSWSVTEELEKGKSSSQLHLATYSQTLCTVLQVALVDLLKAWGISPMAVVGHSSGEIGAAYCLGALSREDAWKIAYYRGLLSAGMKIAAPNLEGAMMAVGISPEQAEKRISQVKRGEVVVACINSPSSVTISGDTAGIDELLDMLKAEGIFARKLKVDTAYHSPHMQMVAQEYFEAIVDIELRIPSGSCKMHSSVTGGLIESSDLGATNWVRNLTSPVQFAAALHDMMRPLLLNGKRSDENALDVLIEIGPHSALQGPASQTLKAYGITNIPYYSAILRNEDAVHTALKLAGSLFAQGAHIDIQKVNNDVENRNNHRPQPLVDIPTYPWNHSQTYWTESRIAKEYRFRKHPSLSLLGAPCPSLAQNEHLWRKFIRLSEEPWISDHQIQSAIVYPAAGFLAMAFEAAHQIADPHQRIAAFRLRDVQFSTAAVISEDFDLECIVRLRPHTTGTRDITSTWTEFMVTTSPDGHTLQRNCSGLLIIDYEPAEGSDASRERDYESGILKNQYLEAAQFCQIHVNRAQFYKDLTAMGLIYGPTFANLAEITSRDGQSFCAVDIPETTTNVLEGLQHRPHIIHPGTLDAIFQMAFAAVNGGKHQLGQPMVPRIVDEVVVSADMPYQPGTRLTGFSNATKHGFKDLKADIVMLDEEAVRPVVKIFGFTCTEIGGGASSVPTDDTAAKQICSKLTWKPAIDVLSDEEVQYVIERENKYTINEAVKRSIGIGELTALKSIDQVLQAVSRDQVVPTMQKFYDWMRLQKGLVETDAHPLRDVLNYAAAHVDSSNTETAAVKQIGDEIEKLLLGQTDSTSLLTVRGVVNEFYLETEGLKAILNKLVEARVLYFLVIARSKTDLASISDCAIIQNRILTF